ncbi:MAG: hypothetical protein ABIG42_05045 [bacterium]
MRILFFISLIIICCVGYANVVFIPAKHRIGKEIIERHLFSLPLGDTEELTFTGHISLLERKSFVEDLHVQADYGRWNNTDYSDVVLNVERIGYDPVSLFWSSRRNIESVDGVHFSGFMPYDQIALRLKNVNVNLIDPVFRYKDDQILLRAYFSPLKEKLEFSGKFVLSPRGDLEYKISRIFDVDGKDITSRSGKAAIEELTNLYIPIEIMNVEIALDELEMLPNGIKISGGSVEEE